MFVSPRAHNTFPWSSTGKQAKTRFAGRKALKGRCCLSPMKKRKFNVMKEVKLSDKGADSPPLDVLQVIVHKDRGGAAKFTLIQSYSQDLNLSPHLRNMCYSYLSFSM